MTMKFYLLLLVLAIWSSSVARDCNPDDELPCLAYNSCIHKIQWCDRHFDCKDGSDEYYCNVARCPESLFHCKNRKCVPASAKCDGFDNCGDGSDEICPRQSDYSAIISIPDQDDIQFYDVTNLNKTDAAVKAAEYLLGKKNHNGWGNFMPRAVVAVAFAERAGGIPGEWTSSLKKELNLRILVDLRQYNLEPKLCDLAHYINALYATCQDPRNFQGIDLVKQLRLEVNKAGQMDLPFVLLTLCIAGQTTNEDTRQLLSMYDNMGDDRISSKALIMMTLACISNSTKTSRETSRLERKSRSFIRNANSVLGTVDIYSKTLYIQALHALGSKTGTDLSTHQQPDGSFGDLLATYYAIPVLCNSSLLDLKCKSSNYEEMEPIIQFPLHGDSDSKNVTFSLWIENGRYFHTHSMNVSLDGNKTFYDVMKVAGAKNSFYRFLYDSSNDGKSIYSLAGIPNDAEIGKKWTLYRAKENSVVFYSKENLTKKKQGVDRIFPRSGDHFIFSYERSLR